MSEWLKNFVGYLIIINIVMHLLPNSKYEHYVRLFAGFLLIVLLLRPILKIGSADLYLEEKITEIMMEQEQLEAEIAAQREVFETQTQELKEESKWEISIREIEKVEVMMDD